MISRVATYPTRPIQKSTLLRNPNPSYTYILLQSREATPSLSADRSRYQQAKQVNLSNLTSFSLLRAFYHISFSVNRFV